MTSNEKLNDLLFSRERAEDAKAKRWATFILGMLLAPLLCVFRAFVVMKLWGWFLVPLGVVPIGKAWAFGLTVLGFILTYSGSVGELADVKEHLGIKANVAGAIGRSLAVSLMALLGGYVAKALM